MIRPDPIDDPQSNDPKVSTRFISSHPDRERPTPRVAVPRFRFVIWSQPLPIRNDAATIHSESSEFRPVSTSLNSELSKSVRNRVSNLAAVVICPTANRRRMLLPTIDYRPILRDFGPIVRTSSHLKTYPLSHSLRSSEAAWTGFRLRRSQSDSVSHTVRNIFFP